VGPGDSFIAQEISSYPQARKIALITKTDDATKEQIATRLMEVDQLADWEALIPVSALLGEQLDVVVREILALMPESDPLYPPENTSEQSTEVRIAELIREATLEGVNEELPHSIAVTIDEMGQREDGLHQIYASLWVERDSQKGIMIGKGGGKLKDIGSRARAEIETLLGHKVYLSIQVKVSKEWQRDAKKITKLGL
jgi:GTP-binding protein Era